MILNPFTFKVFFEREAGQIGKMSGKEVHNCNIDEGDASINAMFMT